MNRADQGMLVFFALIAVAGVAFWIVLPEGPDTVTEEDVTVDLGALVVREARLGNVTLWNATVFVDGVEPGGYPVPWDEVEVVLRSTNLEILFRSDQVRDVETSDGALDLDGETPVAWFSHDDGVDPVVSPGDALVLSGLSREHEGAELELLWNGHTVGVALLPATFG